MNLRVLLVIFSIALNEVCCAQILIIFQLLSRSHYILGNAIARTLMEAGHDITMISPFSEKNPPKNKNGSWTEYILTPGLEFRPPENFFEVGEYNPFLVNILQADEISGLTQHNLNGSAVKTLLKSDAKFDLVIIEQFYNDAMKGFAYHYNAPLILFSPMGANHFINTFVRNPSPLSYIPDRSLNFAPYMSFYERVQNVLFSLFNDILWYLFIFPQQNKILKQYFRSAPDLSELNHNISLVFLNSHVSTSQPKPIIPAMIEIGGYHINPPKPLPKDLQEYLDSATDGAIYFSMGTNLKFSFMPEQQKQAILEALSKLKQKVLWKFEDENFPEKPPNVKISNWLPQQDILAHPNVKLFITHCGLLSTTETIYHGVPVLAIPIFADQRVNAIQMKLGGFGIYLPFSDLTEQKVSNALNELLTNPKYRENAQKQKSLHHDRQVNPRETLVYWVEYVLRHQGAPHLRVSAVDLTWYQYILLDVFAFLTGVFLLAIFITYKIIKFIQETFRKLKTKKQKQT